MTLLDSFDVKIDANRKAEESVGIGIDTGHVPTVENLLETRSLECDASG